MGSISGDALALSVQWAKAFQPWLWNSKEKRWNNTARGQALLASNQEQLQYALESGWTRAAISQRLFQARATKQHVVHVYPLLRQACTTPDFNENLLNMTDDLCHRALFDGQFLKASFTLSDLAAYQVPLFPNEEALWWMLRVLVRDHTLDTILFAIDVAKETTLTYPLRSPFGLKIFLAQAEIERKARLARMRGLALESADTRGTL